MSMTLAVSAAALTWAPGAKYTPCGLTRNTRPLASICPKICDWFAPTTRFRIDAVAPGWLNTTYSSLSTENVDQLTTARAVD